MKALKRQTFLEPSFLAFQLEVMTPKILQSVRGTTAENVSSDVLKQIQLVVPPLRLQQNFAALVDGAERLRQKQQQSEKELEQLFGALLQKYFGENINTVVKPEEHSFAIAAEPEVLYKHLLSAIPPGKKGLAKYLLAGKIIKECPNKKEFTHIRFQKLQHLAEYLLEEDLEQNFYYQAAGTYDNELMHNLANKMKQQHWFNESNYQFTPLDKEPEIDKHFNNCFGSKQAVFQKLMFALGNATEAQCEIVSTLYAIWNDLIILKEPISDETIIDRFYQWSDRKKRYKKHQLAAALTWMRHQRIEPSGFGPVIKHDKGRK